MILVLTHLRSCASVFFSSMKRPSAQDVLKRPAAQEELGVLYSSHKPELTHQDFRNHVRTVLRSILPGKPFEVSFSDNSHEKDDFYNDRLQCISCQDCRWRGVAKYTPANGSVQIKGLPMERTGWQKHGFVGCTVVSQRCMFLTSLLVKPRGNVFHK